MDPTLEQMQELLNLAYQLGWKDRENMSPVRRTLIPPTVTILLGSNGDWTFLYDGQPRP